MHNFLKRVDKFQYQHRTLGFVVAVIRHYSVDQTGNKAALLTYYAFMSLFPLLLWLTYMSNLLNQYHPGLTSVLIHGATRYFPVLGSQLYGIAHAARRSLIGLIVPGLVALYGARGAASVFQATVNDIWGVPKSERRQFPSNWITSIGIVVLGGSGFVVTAIVSSWALGQGQNLWYSLAIGILNMAMFTGLFMLILRLSLPSKVHIKSVIGGALWMSIAMSVLQLVGGFIVTHNLKTYTNAYTTLFAVTLGLLAWIYLQIQILFYAIEVSVVHARHMWPVKLL